MTQQQHRSPPYHHFSQGKMAHCLVGNKRPAALWATNGPLPCGQQRAHCLVGNPGKDGVCRGVAHTHSPDAETSASQDYTMEAPATPQCPRVQYQVGHWLFTNKNVRHCVCMEIYLNIYKNIYTEIRSETRPWI